MISPKNFFFKQSPTFLLIFFCLSSTLVAQEFGIKGGLSYSGQTYEYDLPSLELNRLKQSGFFGGVFISYDIWLLSGLRFELDYVQKGSSIEVFFADEASPDINGVLRIDDRLEYISFNLLLTPGLSNNSTTAPYLVVGPRADILLNTSSEIPSLVFDHLMPIIVGATVGLGISLPLSNSTLLLIEGVYNYDFSFAYDEDILTIKNNAVLLTTGITF